MDNEKYMKEEADLGATILAVAFTLSATGIILTCCGHSWGWGAGVQEGENKVRAEMVDMLRSGELVINKLPK